VAVKTTLRLVVSNLDSCAVNYHTDRAVDTLRKLGVQLRDALEKS
jgi:hypothetical protein